MSEDMELPGAEDTEEILGDGNAKAKQRKLCLLYTSPSPRDS